MPGGDHHRSSQAVQSRPAIMVARSRRRSPTPPTGPHSGCLTVSSPSDQRSGQNVGSMFSAWAAIRFMTLIWRSLPGGVSQIVP